MPLIEKVIADTVIESDDNDIVETVDADDLIARNERLLESMDD